jgi:REP-associated tyrosine transposase
MSSHIFHEIYLHLNWHTKDSEPLIAPSIEPAVYEILRNRCRQYGGVIVDVIGGTETHVHLAIQIKMILASDSTS